MCIRDSTHGGSDGVVVVVVVGAGTSTVTATAGATLDAVSAPDNTPTSTGVASMPLAEHPATMSAKPNRVGDRRLLISTIVRIFAANVTLGEQKGTQSGYLAPPARIELALTV